MWYIREKGGRNGEGGAGVPKANDGAAEHLPDGSGHVEESDAAEGGAEEVAHGRNEKQS
jgi:hypothetical protein